MPYLVFSMMTDTQNTIFPTLEQMFPENTTDLHRRTPFQLLIAVIMSAQTTDIQVNKVTDTLFQTIRTPLDVIDMGEQSYNRHISSIGLHNSKSKHIYHTSQRLIKLHTEKVSWVVPFFSTDSSRDTADHAPTIGDLTTLPGVGIKTAKVVLHVLWNAPYIAVDTHVHRVTNRLGLVNTQTPEQTDRILESVIKPAYRYIAHHTLIFFGRYHCTARKPRCRKCPLYHVCARPDKKLYTSNTLDG